MPSPNPNQTDQSRPAASASKIAILRSAAFLGLPFVLAGFFFCTHPFRDELVCKVFSLASLNPNQQFNIELAAHALDRYVLKPGEEFSFNKIVGPRSDGKGYRPAPSYLGPDSPATIGGGICLVSSALYQAALAAGLQIDERVPHMRTIASVPPGLDATVWYGRADLKFRNTSSHPLEIKAECKNHNLYVSLLSERAKDTAPIAVLKTFISRHNRDELLVEVFRDQAGTRTFISRDNYRISK